MMEKWKRGHQQADLQLRLGPDFCGSASLSSRPDQLMKYGPMSVTLNQLYWKYRLGDHTHEEERFFGAEDPYQMMLVTLVTRDWLDGFQTDEVENPQHLSRA